MSDQADDKPVASFRRIKRRPKTLRQKEDEAKQEAPQTSDGNEDEEEVSSRLADIQEAQLTRKRQNGMTALECAVGKKLAKEFSDLDDDPFQMRGGKNLELTDDKKLALTAVDIEHNIKKQFMNETLLRNEHEEMKKFIDQRLNFESAGNSIDASNQKKANPATVEDEILMKVAEKLSGYKSKTNDELMSNQMLVGIPEVDLGIDVRIKNVMETEQKKTELLSKCKN
ncbi:hypothetical protein M3Y97_00449700 [Aphelenchoides bicaudatus]|nr:hypothetical protein M3Y97_00449700 [Aphelenchoides bicaudatus]